MLIALQLREGGRVEIRAKFAEGVASWGKRQTRESCVGGGYCQL